MYGSGQMEQRAARHVGAWRAGKKTMIPSLDFLPAGERARRYREFAAAAFGQAGTAETEELRAEYLSMAAGWHSMAFELEHSSQV